MTGSQHQQNAKPGEKGRSPSDQSELSRDCTIFKIIGWESKGKRELRLHFGSVSGKREKRFLNQVFKCDSFGVLVKKTLQQGNINLILKSELRRGRRVGLGEEMRHKIHKLKISLMMTTYLVLATLWTLYMGFETYVFTRPQSRPHFVGFLITHLLLAPLSFAISLTSGVLRERIETAYRAAWHSKQAFRRSGRKKLIG